MQASGLKGMNQGHQNPGAGSPDWMAKCAGAAVDVHLFMADAQFLDWHHRDGCEGFIDFEQVDIGNRPAGLAQYRLDGTDRRRGEPFRGLGKRSLGDDARNRFQTVGNRIGLGAQDQGCGAVIDAGRAGCRDGAVFFECRAQARNFFDIALAGLLVAGDLQLAFTAR